MTEILLLGSFHFRDRNIDFSLPEIQNQLKEITQKLLKFSPQKIAVELAYHSQDVVDKSYGMFSFDNLFKKGKLQGPSLGQITMFGELKDINYKNEDVQIGYRLGKLLNHSRIYAIDYDSLFNEIGEKYFNEKRDEYIKFYDKLFFKGDETNLRDMLMFYNSEEWSYNNNQVYMLLNAYDGGKEFGGAEAVSEWYSRNLKIFTNIQKLCTDCERLFIVYGAGHLKILRDLIKDCYGMKLVNTNDYLL